MPQPCPLCDNQKRMRRPKLLYHHPVCKKCYYRFANRRQFAFVIDYVLIFIVVTIMQQAIITPALLAIAASNELFLGLDVLTELAFLGLLFFKDGLAGQSPGKAICGVRVLDRTTGRPIGFVASLKRNLPLLIPFMPLIIAFQMCRGPRIGDGLSGSRVIWKRYADLPMFRGESYVEPDEAPDAAMTQQIKQQLAQTPDDDNPYRTPQF